MLKLKKIYSFWKTANPCDSRPFYAEDCGRCMDKFCKENRTTREEYHRRSATLRAVVQKIGELRDKIKVEAFKDEPNLYIMKWAREEMHQLEKEIEVS